jgi:hypothetical protein
MQQHTDIEYFTADVEFQVYYLRDILDLGWKSTMTIDLDVDSRECGKKILK